MAERNGWKLNEDFGAYLATEDLDAMRERAKELRAQAEVLEGFVKALEPASEEARAEAVIEVLDLTKRIVRRHG